jgi:YidC/Oxa1 family membrane protein insertase
VNIFDLVIVQPIFNLLIGIYSLIPGGDFGIALIIFTILIRFALWPLVQRQLHQVKAMRKLQPELAKIKKAANGNRQLESMQMLELYKKHDVKPFRSILILLIQLPIFIALYQVIQIFTLHRDQVASYTYGFLKGIEPIQKLIEHPDQFNEKLLGLVDLTAHAIGSSGVNIFLVILAIVAAFTQYIISKQTSPTTTTKRFRDVLAEASAGKQADQSELNAVMMSKMTKILPFFMLFIMLSLPGALALYYVVSNVFAALQQHYLLNRDKKELEEIADEVIMKPTAKKATAKARAKQAQEANIIRIKAKDTPRSNKKGDV